MQGDDQEQPSLLLTYGKGDDRIMMMTLSMEAVREYLQPLETMDPEEYKFCTIGDRYR